jgi:hypothetical protein
VTRHHPRRTVVRGTPPDPGRPVVGVDGSPVSEAAFAFDAAATRHVPLVAVQAWMASLIGTGPADPAVLSAPCGLEMPCVNPLVSTRLGHGPVRGTEILMRGWSVRA